MSNAAPVADLIAHAARYCAQHTSTQFMFASEIAGHVLASNPNPAAAYHILADNLRHAKYDGVQSPAYIGQMEKALNILQHLV
jgi:hypothetical protein